MVILGPFLDAAVLERIAAKVNQIGGGGAVTVVSPVIASGDVHLIAGDTYAAGDGRALVWTSADWPDLTGATLTLTAVAEATGDMGLDHRPCTLLQAAGPGRVQCELTSAQTAALPTGLYRYSLDAVLPSGSTITLARGDMTVEPNLEGGA